ncbi:hypothetical protein FRC09_006372, partial [Ceratobasidium sp. 395]
LVQEWGLHLVFRELQRVGTRADASGRLLSKVRAGRPGGSAKAVQLLPCGSAAYGRPARDGSRAPAGDELGERLDV